MRFDVLATDYDGMLARHGTVEPATLGALERVRTSGRRTVLVTGRQIEDLKRIYSRFDLFDVVVGENGAILYYPASGMILSLHEPPSSRFIQKLRSRGTPLSVGHVIVSSHEPHDAVIFDAIKTLGLELEIILTRAQS